LYYFILTYYMRWPSSGKSRSQQEIKVIYPNTLWMMCAVQCLLLQSSVLWPVGDLRATW